MSESKMSDIIKASLDGIKEFTDVDTVFGRALTTPSGVTIIPVSKVSVGFASGGLDYAEDKKLLPRQNFGGGSGTGVSVTPVAFLTISAASEINLIEIGKNKAPTGIEKAIELIENSPDILSKIKSTFTG